MISFNRFIATEKRKGRLQQRWMKAPFFMRTIWLTAICLETRQKIPVRFPVSGSLIVIT